MNKIVRATAGAGKTTGLLEAVYQTYQSSFLASGVYPKILLSTFTVKAANELTERLTNKAIEEKDSQFLNFVSSGFLEVGTLHSVFLKVYENLKSEGTSESQKFLSSSSKRQVGRYFLHQVLKNECLDEFIKEAREEVDVLECFWHLYSYSFKSVIVPKIEDLQNAVIAEVQEFFDLLGVTVGFDFKSLFVEVDLVDLIDIVDESVDPLIKKKKLYKDFVKFCNNPKNQKEFLDLYALKNEKIFFIYQLWKEELDKYFDSSGAFDISDVEVKLLAVLKSKGLEDKIWDFCFFDEYQDTSPIQKDILDYIARDSSNYFVGDPFQSIYFFRGARKEIFLDEFKNIEQKNGVTEFRLNNYRSANDIVEFANGLIKFLVPDFMEMIPFHVSQAGHNSIVYFEEGSLTDELNYVVKKIDGRDYHNSSAAVLCRSVKELLLLARRLKERKVAFKLSLSKGFESSLEVIEIANVLKFAVGPNDDVSFRVILFSKWVNVTHVEIQKAVEACKESGDSLWSHFLEHSGFSGLRSLIENLQTANLSNALIDFLGESGFLDQTDVLDPSGVREKNIVKFLGALISEEVKEGFNPLEFSDDVLKGYYRFESEDMSSETGVTLMTVHGSKGLQFDDVFLIGANKPNRSGTKSFYFDLDKHFFGIKVKETHTVKFEHALYLEQMIDREKKEMSEERKRLLYVAMTRAKKTLTILGSKKITKDSKDPTWMNSILQFLELSGQTALLECPESLERPDDKVKALDLKTSGFLENTNKLTFADRAFQGVTQNLHEQEGRSESQRDLVFFSKAISEGVLFHELMEKAKGLEDAKRLVPVFFGADAGSKHQEALEYLFAQTEVPFKNIFEQGFREWGFDTSGETQKSGKIDIWAKLGNTIWVVDYKTGALDSLEKGFEQLSAYKEVLTDFNNIEKPEIKTVLIFPYKKKVFVR